MLMFVCCLFFSQHQRPEPDSLIALMVAVKQQNVNLLEQTLLNVSDPTHTMWGNHLSMEEVDDMVSVRCTYWY